MTSPLQQKLKVHGPVVVTGNRTVDGAVIYWTAGGRWATALADAAVVTTAAQAQAMLKAASVDDVAGVGAYVAPVELADHNGVKPGNLREQIRVAGPTFALPGAQPG
jgi:hypothetical protein